eukprot:6298785-Alexandrium_andersonii.AAC.1
MRDKVAVRGCGRGAEPLAAGAQDKAWPRVYTHRQLRQRVRGGPTVRTHVTHRPDTEPTQR